MFCYGLYGWNPCCHMSIRRPVGQRAELCQIVYLPLHEGQGGGHPELRRQSQTSDAAGQVKVTTVGGLLTGFRVSSRRLLSTYTCHEEMLNREEFLSAWG